MKRVIYSAGLLIDGMGQAPLKDAYVLVEDGRILEVGAGRPPETWTRSSDPSTPVEHMAMPEATIIPGLIDAHLHLALALSRPDWAQIDAEPGRMALLAAQGAQETLRSGVTTIADCGARYGVTIQLRDAIASGQMLGSRLWACGTWLTVTNGHGYFWTHWGMDNADELRKGLRQMVWDGADFIKIMASGGSTQGSKTNRRRAQYSVAELRAAVEDAHRLNKRVHCHVNATEAMRNCIEAGVDVVEHCNWLGAEEGTVEYDEGVSRLGAQNGTIAGINGGDGPFNLLTLRDGFAQDWGQMTRWDLFRRMQDVGMRVYINTDAIGQELNGLPRLMQRMVDENKASAMETLQLSTLVPAQALGLEGWLGSLEKGKLADMVFLPKNPLVDMSAVTRPLMVIKEGQVVVREGQLIW
jgi:imidazolonepropionase-like amidohydrolase